MAIKQQLDALGGANTNLSPFISPPNTLTVCNGVNPSYKLGALLKDTGYMKVGDTLQANKSITGLYNFRQSAVTQKILATVNNSAETNLTLKYNNSGTWTDISLGAAWDAYEDCKVEFESFLGYCFMVGYDSTDDVFLPVASLTGTTFSTSTNVTNMAQGKYICRYRDRLYVANSYYSAAAYPYRVYYSSVPSAGAITWTPASNYLDIDYGDYITGICSAWDRLLVFTPESTWLYDSSTWKKTWAYGCSNHRTIKTFGELVYFANQDGVYVTAGGKPQNISGPIFELIKTATMTNAFAEIIDEEYNLYLGTVTCNGVSYSNCMATFNIPTQLWRWRELGGAMTIFAKYNNSGINQLYMGTSVGTVMSKGKYTDATLVTSDGGTTATNGSAIGANFEYAPQWLDLSKENKFLSITCYAEKAVGLNIKARILNKNTRALTPYVFLDQLKGYINYSQPIWIQEGIMIQIAGSECSTNQYFSYFGHQFDIESSSKILK